MVESNNAINNTVGASISGVTNTLTITNPSNTASSAAREIITVGGASSADASLNFNVSGVTDWEMGIDNNDSDKLKVSQGTALGTNDTWIMTKSGERTMPLQPRFSATISASINNVTGDNTSYRVLYNTENFDVGGVYDNTTGIFTAPIDGVYVFGCGVTFFNLNSSHTSMIAAYNDGPPTTTFSARLADGNPFASKGSDAGGYYVHGTAIFNLTAGTNISTDIIVAGGTKTVGVRNNFPTLKPSETFFYGYLLC